MTAIASGDTQGLGGWGARRTTRRSMLRAAGGGAVWGAGGVLAACGLGAGGTPAPAKPANLKAELRFMFFHDQWKEAFDQVIKNFGAKYPNVTVTFETDPSYIPKVTTQLLAGGART